MEGPVTFFASYSRRDKACVEPVVELLRSGSAQVFLDESHIKPGDQWQLVLESNLEQASTLLVFWSRHAKRSKWVTKEWTKAAEAGKRIIPVRLDDTELPAGLANFQYIDFRSFRRGAKWVPLLGVVSVLSLLGTVLLLVSRSVMPLVASKDLVSRDDAWWNDERLPLAGGGVALVLCLVTLTGWIRKRKAARADSTAVAKDIVKVVAEKKRA